MLQQSASLGAAIKEYERWYKRSIRLAGISNLVALALQHGGSLSFDFGLVLIPVIFQVPDEIRRLVCICEGQSCYAN